MPVLMGGGAYGKLMRDRVPLSETKVTLGLTRPRLRGLTGADDVWLRQEFQVRTSRRQPADQ